MPVNQAPPSLQGRRVALTLAADDPFSPADALRQAKAALLYYPVIQTLPPDSYDSLDNALKQSFGGEVDWLLLTTPCAVEAVASRLTHLGIAAADKPSAKVAYYGAKTQITAAALITTWQSALPPGATTAATHEEMVSALRIGTGSQVAIPLAQRSRANWSELVTATGATLLDAPAYRLILGRGGDDLPALLWGGFVDSVIFLTENSLRHFSVRLKVEGGSLDMLRDVVVACLDQQTAAAARIFGLHVHVIPEQPTYDALVAGLAHHFSAIHSPA